MKFTLQTTQFPHNFLRQAGYSVFRDPNTSQTSYTRRLGTGFYPRFHVYIKENLSPDLSPKVLTKGESLAKRGIEFNLHLDQKHASYQGQKAHSGEYDSDLVKKEAERIQTLAAQQPESKPEKKSFWKKWFSSR